MYAAVHKCITSNTPDDPPSLSDVDNYIDTIINAFPDDWISVSYSFDYVVF